MKRTAVTIVDVAKRAGVSLMTASRVLNGKGASNEAREKVTLAVRELGYEPSGMARVMKGGRTSVIGIIVNDLSSFASTAFAAALSETIRDRGLDLFVYSAPGGLDHSGQQKMNRSLRDLSDGLVYVLPRASREHIQQLERETTPIVLLSYCHETSLPVVRADNANGARDAVNYLIDSGHRRIAFITGLPQSGQSPERETGYRKALESAQLPFAPELIEQGDFSESSGLFAARKLLSLPEPPTAIFAANDKMAIGCMTAIREKNLRIPEDISLIGFDDIEIASLVQPGLTTLRHPVQAMAYAAVDELLRRIEEQPGRRLLTEFPSEFIIRGSTGSAPAARGQTRRKAK